LLYRHEVSLCKSSDVLHKFCLIQHCRTVGCGFCRCGKLEECVCVVVLAPQLSLYPGHHTARLVIQFMLMTVLGLRQDIRQNCDPLITT
jgi:hypothetical protein